MYKLFVRTLPLVHLLIAVSCTAEVNGQESPSPPEIHSKHFFYGYPQGAPVSNDLIIRNIYALSSNDDTKLADWVAYRLDQATVQGDIRQSRNWKSDPWLDSSETLEPADYTGANAALHVDRGHQAPLASFKGTISWSETNFLSNITPQKSNLNQGPWKILEDRVRGLVADGYVVFVMTGPLYEREMPSLPNADESHRIPSGYWKIVLVQESGSVTSIKAASFIFDQETPRGVDVLDSLGTIDEVELRSGLDFLRELPDDLETTMESNDFRSWAEQWLR